MIVVRVELHSAITGMVSELARMDICNDGTGDNARGNYNAQTNRGRDRRVLARRIPQRTTRIEGYRRNALHVWNLVAIALNNMGYGK